MDVPVPGELRIAMEELCDALRARDTKAFLRAFSQTQPFRDVNGAREGDPGKAVSYATLARELAAKQGLYRALFGEERRDQLRRYVVGEYQGPWAAASEVRFVPRGLSEAHAWISWRAEGDRWVVDAIARPRE
jgi:hypothetical protein